jgi:hypothetical protein
VRAVGPRHARAPPRPVRRVRGRRAGGAAGRGPAVAGRRDSGPAAVVVADRGRAGLDRRVAGRQRPPAPRSRGGAGPGRPGAGERPGRHADVTVPVLPIPRCRRRRSWR